MQSKTYLFIFGYQIAFSSGKKFEILLLLTIYQLIWYQAIYELKFSIFYLKFDICGYKNGFEFTLSNEHYLERIIPYSTTLIFRSVV